MKIRPIAALLVCAALVSPSAAQTRVAAAVVRGPAGLSFVPAFGDLSSPVAPSFNGVLSAPSMTPGLPASPVIGLSPTVVPACVLAITVLPPLAAQPRALTSAKASVSFLESGAAVAEASLRAEGESFWSGSHSRSEVDDAIAVVAPSSARTPISFAYGAVAVSPAVAVLPALPHWAASAVPYVEGAAVLAGTYALTRTARWAIDKAASRLGWDKNAIVMARFISKVVLWTIGAGVGLSVLGVSGTTLLATFGAGGTATALALTFAVRDVVGNLFHGVHFLLFRPFTIGDKVTIGKTTGVVHDLTFRYLVIRDESGGFILYTYNNIAAAAVKLFGEYTSKELRLRLGQPAFPRGFLRALRDAATPVLWKPILFSVLAIGALSFFPMLPPILKGTTVSGLAFVLPYLKAGLVAFLTSSLSRTLKAGIERLALRYGWTRPATMVAKLGATVLTWIIGGSFLLNVAGVSWVWVAGTLSLSTLLVSIAVNDYVNAVFQGSLLLMLKPFQIGDRVTIGEHAGTVVDITLQHVVLKLDAESFMLIPHSVVKDSAIITPREYGQRRK